MVEWKSNVILKTYEKIVRGRTLISKPKCIPSAKRKKWLKILEITLKEKSENLDVLWRDVGKMRVKECTFYECANSMVTTKQWELHFYSLVMSLFTQQNSENFTSRV